MIWAWALFNILMYIFQLFERHIFFFTYGSPFFDYYWRIADWRENITSTREAERRRQQKKSFNLRWQFHWRTYLNHWIYCEHISFECIEFNEHDRQQQNIYNKIEKKSENLVGLKYAHSSWRDNEKIERQKLVQIHAIVVGLGCKGAHHCHLLYIFWHKFQQ